MKKVFILAIISLILVTPNIVFAEGEYCADENLRDYRQELGNIDYEYVIDYDDVKSVDKDGYPVDYINVSMTGLPDDYIAVIKGKGDELFNLATEEPKVSGGVIEVYFYNNNCSKELKKEEIFLPYYNKGELKPFNDGSVITSKKTTSSLLITVVLSFIVVILFIVSIFVIKKGRKS